MCLNTLEGNAMKSFVYVLTDNNGIHARPAGALIKEVKNFTSDVTIAHGEKRADMKKLFALMGLGAKKDDSVTIALEGPDEEKEAVYLEQYMQKHF
jgi:phosphocarrier protein